MENQSNILDSNSFELENNLDKQKIISLNKFIILSIVSFGLYEIWWMYKAWRFFQQKEGSTIMPAARAIFGVFYFYSLLEKIEEFASQNGFTKRYSSGQLFGGFLFFNFLSILPDPYWLISLLAFVFTISPFIALNYAIQHSKDIKTKEQDSFSVRQVVLIMIGIIFWILVLYGFTIQE